MRVLREGLRGEDVEAWQRFLAEENFNPGSADGIFGAKTTLATKTFQKQFLLVSDGIVGAQTMTKALQMGFDPLEWPASPPANTNDPYWPAPPAGLTYLSEVKAFQLYGQFTWQRAPTPAEPRAIKIAGTWEADNLITVDIPQLSRIGKPQNTKVLLHRKAALPIQKLWAAWEVGGLLRLVKSWNGLFNARTIGMSNTVSNHAFGCAFDINATTNPWGGNIPTVGQPGCVRELVPLANQHGFFWGGHYKGKKDGMHFELSRP